MSLYKELTRAAKIIHHAKALVITSGSGMGVDSGLPDFRGSKGFWRAYPPLQKLKIDLPSMSNPRWFQTDPEFAWGFFGHRYNLYSKTEPHKGFKILLDWGEQMEHGYFVFTSNVDGHFQKAGFNEENLYECHGSINFLQLVDTSKHPHIWPTGNVVFDLNEETLHLKSTSELPLGPPDNPSFLARPNILMFSDWGWLSSRSDEQEMRYFDFQEKLQQSGLPFVVIEIGSGTAVPTVRLASEDLIGPKNNSVLIRINPNEPAVPEPARNISLKMCGLEALEELDKLLKAEEM